MSEPSPGKALKTVYIVNCEVEMISCIISSVRSSFALDDQLIRTASKGRVGGQIYSVQFQDSLYHAVLYSALFVYKVILC